MAAADTATGFAPGNVSCVFKVIPDDDPARMHSLGMGFTVTEGVTATVRRARRTGTTFNGQSFDFATVRSVLEALSDQPLHVDLSSKLPLSGGFGLSGASALAAAYAVDALLGLGGKPQRSAMVAHVAEVEHLTGLGDVAGQFHGGCNVKLTPGDPLAATRLPVPEQVVHYRYFSPIHTKDVIGSMGQRQRINAAAERALEMLASLQAAAETAFERYIAVAKQFAIESELLRDERVRESITAAERAGGAASMIMLGNAVFSTVAFPGSKRTRLSMRAAGVVG
jgi:pantoate kinase